MQPAEHNPQHISVFPTKYSVVMLLIILAAALFMRLYRLDDFSLWNDTGVTYITCTTKDFVSMLEMQRRIVPDTPPLDPIIRYFTLRLFGENTYIFVLPSVLLSVLGIACVFILARDIFNERVALITVFLLAIHPLDIEYAQEGRNYAILNVLVPGATLLFLRALKTATLRHWLGYGFLLAACFYSHLLTAGVVIAHASIFLLYSILPKVSWNNRWREELPKAFAGYCMANLLAIGLFSPWLVGYVSGRLPYWMAQRKAAAVQIISPLPTVLKLFGYSSEIFYLLWILFLVACFHALYTRRLNRLCVPLIFALGYAVSYHLTKRSFFHFRYMLYTLPFVLMFCACGISLLSDLLQKLLIRVSPRLGFRYSAAMASGALLLYIVSVTVEPIKAAYAEGWDYHGDYRAAARYVQARFRPGDVVLTSMWHRDVFSAYATEPVIGFTLYPIESQIRESANNSLTGRQWYDFFYNVDKLECDSALSAKSWIFSQQFSRIWVIWNHDPGWAGSGSGGKSLFRWLDSIAERKDEAHVNKLEILNYEPFHDLRFDPGPFFGWTSVDGLAPLEGPYPHWNLPAVRWARGSTTRLVLAGTGDEHLLLLNMRRNENDNQEVRGELNGKEVFRFRLGPSWAWHDLAVPLVLVRGKNDLLLRYAATDRHGLSVLFRRLQILTGSAISRAALDHELPSRYIRRHRREGDAVIVPEEYLWAVGGYSGVPTYGVAKQPGPLVTEADELQLTAAENTPKLRRLSLSNGASQEQGMRAHLMSMGYRRVWLMWPHSHDDGRGSALLKLLSRAGEPVTTSDFDKFRLSLFSVRLNR